MIVPNFDPEINSDADIFKYNIEKIHTYIPHKWLNYYLGGFKRRFPKYFEKVNFIFFLVVLV